MKKWWIEIILGHLFRNMLNSINQYMKQHNLFNVNMLFCGASELRVRGSIRPYLRPTLLRISAWT
jgi:hypothetical protein